MKRIACRQWTGITKRLLASKATGGIHCRTDSKRIGKKRGWFLAKSKKDCKAKML